MEKRVGMGRVKFTRQELEWREFFIHKAADAFRAGALARGFDPQLTINCSYGQYMEYLLVGNAPVDLEVIIYHDHVYVQDVDSIQGEFSTVHKALEFAADYFAGKYSQYWV